MWAFECRFEDEIDEHTSNQRSRKEIYKVGYDTLMCHLWLDNIPDFNKVTWR
jgi:hypothetical protein